MAEFPFDQQTWENIISRLNEKIAQENKPEDAEKLRKHVKEIFNVGGGPGTSVVPPFPYPRAPVFTKNMSVVRKIDVIQNYLNQLQYNHTGNVGMLLPYR